MQGGITTSIDNEPVMQARVDFLKTTLTRKQKVMMDVMYDAKNIQTMIRLLLAKTLNAAKIVSIVKKMRRMMKLRMNHDDQYKTLDNPIIFIDSVRRDSSSDVMFWKL